ncbi:MAG TPA: DinB family protein [Limnochordales bacterium]
MTMTTLPTPHDPASDALRWMLQTSAEGLQSLVKDMDEEEMSARPQGLAPVVWQIGHVAVFDAQLACWAGHSVDIPLGWEALFAKGASGEGPLPTMESVMALLRKANEELVKLCATDLGRPVITSSGQTAPLSSQLVFHLFHRGYHAGKIMTLRALLGKPRLLG